MYVPGNGVYFPFRINLLHLKENVCPW